MSMTVGQLRAALKDVPDDVIVVMDSDAEGNNHSPLAQVDLDHRYDGSPYDGEVFDTTDSYWTTEDSIPADAVPCVLLTPVN